MKQVSTETNRTDKKTCSLLQYKQNWKVAWFFLLHKAACEQPPSGIAVLREGSPRRLPKILKKLVMDNCFEYLPNFQDI